MADESRCVRVKLGRHTAFLSFGGPTLWISGDGSGIGGFVFEMHPYCGPVRCSDKTGEPVCQDWSPRSPFWALFERWTRGGKQVDSFGRCILAPALVMCKACAGVGYKLGSSPRHKAACPSCGGTGRVAPPTEVDRG